MSEVVIKLKAADYMTHVLVDGKVAYKTAVHPKVEKEKLDSLFKLVTVENVKAEIAE